MRKLGLIVACVVVIVAIAGVITLYATYQREFLVAAQAQSEMIGLRQSVEGVKAINALGSDAAFIAIDRSFFDKLGGAFSGKTISMHSKDMDDDIQISVEAFSIRPETGKLTAHLDLVASSVKRGLSIGLAVDGFGYFAGISTESSTVDDGEVDAANFKIVPVSIVPRLQYGFIDIRARQFASDAITGGVLSFLFDKLSWKAAYRPHLNLSYNASSTITQHFGTENAGAVVLIATPSPLHFENWLTIVAPVFTNRGVILAATLKPTRQAEIIAPPPVIGAVNSQDLESARHSIEVDAASLSDLFSKDIAVAFGRAGLTHISTELGNTVSGFSVSVRGKSISGRLFDKPWRDKILGDGGFFAEILDANAIDAEGRVSKPAISIDPKMGPVLSLPINVSFSAPVHVQVDPLIGGGVGTTIGVKGSATTTLAAWFAATKFSFEGNTIGLGGPILSCTLVSIDARSDGKLKIDGGWATVPEIGAKVGQLIGQHPFAPTIIAEPTTVVPIVAATPTNERQTAVFAVLDGLFASLSLDDFGAEMREKDYRLATSIKIALANHAPDPASGDQRKRLDAAAADYWMNTMAQKCPDLPGVRIEVGDLEIGPNGEIMKFLKNAWSDITKGPGKNNEVVKLLGRIQANTQDYDAATKQMANDVGNMAKGAFPTDSAVGHAAGELGKSVTIAVTNPVGAVGGFIHQVGRLFK